VKKVRQKIVTIEFKLEFSKQFVFKGTRSFSYKIYIWVNESFSCIIFTSGTASEIHPLSESQIYERLGKYM